MKQFEGGKKIKALRLKSGISQEELATLTQLSLRTIQRIENGETNPRGDSLKRIAAALNSSVEEFALNAPADPVSVVLKDDNAILLLLNFAAFGYLITPLLGILLPMMLWLFYKDKIGLVNSIGKQVMKFQVGWCLMLLLVYGYVFGLKFLHLNLPVPKNDKAVAVFIAVLYVFNSLVIIINLIKLMEIKKNIRRLSLQ